MADPEQIEAEVRRKMAQHASLKPAADRGSSDARRDRRLLHAAIDGLLDRRSLVLLELYNSAFDAPTG